MLEPKCITCPLSLLCIGGRTDAWDGFASFCPEHDYGWVWTAKPIVEPEPPMVDLEKHVMIPESSSKITGVGPPSSDPVSKDYVDTTVSSLKWKEQNYFADIFGVACNCKVAEMCDRLVQFSSSGRVTT